MHGKERYQHLRSFETLLLIKPRPLLRNSIYTRRSVATDYCIPVTTESSPARDMNKNARTNVPPLTCFLRCCLTASKHLKLRISFTCWYSNLLITAFINSTQENWHDLFCNLYAMSIPRSMTKVFDHERIKRIWAYFFSLSRVKSSFEKKLLSLESIMKHFHD